MLTLNTNWENAIRQSNVELIVHVRIDLSVAPDPIETTVYDFVSGAPRFNASGSVVSISTISAKVDPFSRDITLGSWTVEFSNDGILRDLILNNQLLNKRVTIRLGTPDLDFADYQEIADFLTIDKIIPKRNTIELELLDMDSVRLQRLVDPYSYPDHPLRYLEAAANYLHPDAAAPSAQFDETADTARSHYVVTRHQFNNRTTIYRPDWLEMQSSTRVPYGEYIQGVGRTYHAGIVPTELGPGRVVIFDQEGNANRIWTSDDIQDFEVTDSHAELFNRARMGGVRSASEDFQFITVTDDVSAQDLAYSAGAFRHYERTVWLEWFHSHSIMQHTLFGGPQDFPDIDDTTYVVSAPLYNGFCGTLMRTPPSTYRQAPDSTINAAHAISASRPAYHMITDHAGNWEIVRAEGFFYNTTTDPGVRSYDDLIEYWPSGTFTVVRAQLGTSAVDWRLFGVTGGRTIYVYDITMARDLAIQLLNRHSYGMPIATVRTSAAQYDVQIGDFVLLPASFYVANGADGADAVMWEVVGKEFAFNSSGTYIKWELAWVRNGVYAAITATAEYIDEPVSISTIPREPYYDSTGATYVDSLGGVYYPNY